MNETKTRAADKVIWMITERGDRVYWTRIGSGVVHRDGSITLTLDALPVGGGKLQVRDFTPREETNPET